MRGITAAATTVTLALTGLLAACAGDGGGAGLGASLVADVSVGPPDALDDAYHAEDRGVRVDYTLTNAGEEPLLVVTERGHDQSAHGSAPDRPDAVWVSGRGDGVARLSKQMFDLPSGISPTDPWTAPAAVVQPGESITGHMFVRLPVRPNLPPESGLLSHDEEPLGYRPDQVEACIQVAPLPEGVPDPTAMTMVTSGRVLACADPLPIPRSG